MVWLTWGFPVLSPFVGITIHVGAGLQPALALIPEYVSYGAPVFRYFLAVERRAGYKPAPTRQQSAYDAAHGERIMTFPLMVSLSNHPHSVLRQAQDERHGYIPLMAPLMVSGL